VGEERAWLADLAEHAARLCKADLVTEMVGEFPELQGVMGGYYAYAEGLGAEISEAIGDHYKPVGQGDLVPTAPVTVAVSLADKLDTLIAFFAAGMAPSGSKDPFALRRSALGILSLLQANGARLSITRIVIQTFEFVRRDYLSMQMMTELAKLRGKNIKGSQEHLGRLMVSIMNSLNPDRPMNDTERNAAAVLAEQVLDFFADRLKVQQREAGVRHDLIDAVFALGNEDDLVRLLARVNALQNFIATEDGANLLAAYKRAANILRKEDWQGAEGEIARTGEEDPLALVDDPDLKPVIAAKMAEKKKKSFSYSPEPEEKALIEALDSAEPKAHAAVEGEDFEAAMAALATLRAPIDRFFDNVTVNDADPAKRQARLALLARFRDAVHQVADFSKIEG
jgi:glycyl-tRNA synthetase beta chain